MDELTHLLLSARDGDREAFAAAVGAAGRTVERFVASLVDADDVEDVVQDTFVRAWGSVHRFRGEASGRTWLLAIARRAAADAVQGRVRRRSLTERLVAVRPATRAGLPEWASVENLLDGLDPTRRQAFVLTQLLGLSYEEAAGVCGVPIGTIRSRVARARAELLDACGVAEEAVGG